MAETAQKDEISVQVNGDARAIPAGCSIAGMLRAIGIDPRKVAVERNLEVVPRSTLEEVKVRDGDAFEIVHFVGGG
jgi:thiamine biosynthesis protein ThiS